MSIDHGMSIDEVEQLAASLREVATRLRTMRQSLQSNVSRAPWSGPTATRFKSEWWPRHRALMDRIRTDLEGFATCASNNAADQRATSESSFAALGTGSAQAVAMESRLLANRHRVEGERERLRTKLSGKQGARLLLDHPGEYESELRRFELYERVLRENRQILFFDPQGDGEIAVAAGDVRTAKHLAVTVPGISNKLDNYWTLLDDADRLRTSSGEDTAVVAWLGYDTPIDAGGAVLQDLNPFDGSNSGIRQITTDAYAKNAAPLLAGFVNQLHGTNPDASISVFGHSYGSVVTSMAAQQGLKADNVVFLGSPGMGGATSVADFKLNQGARVYAAVPRGVEYAGLSVGGDYVDNLASNLRGMHSLGVSPYDPAFGAVRLDIGSSALAFTHDKYYAAGSQSLSQMTAVMLGNGPDAGARGGW